VGALALTVTRELAECDPVRRATKTRTIPDLTHLPARYMVARLFEHASSRLLG
jgi:hypothetical protein